MQTDHRPPPQSLDSEMSVLGAVFVTADALDRALEIIDVDDFYREPHRKIFNAMIRLNALNEPIDLVTTSDVLRKSGELEEVGGAAYLATLLDFVPTAANVHYYCNIVAEKSVERRLIACAENVKSMIHNNTPVPEVIETLESAITSLSKPQKQEAVHTKELVIESVKRLQIRHRNKGTLQGMPWGIEGLDAATTGIQRGDLIIIAGRPSMGKSALAGNILRSAGQAGNYGRLQSLEMPRMDCMDRWIADVGNVKYHHLRNGRVEDHEWTKHTRASEEISRWNVLVDDTPSMSLAKIKSRAKRQKRTGLDILVVDYLQLIQVNSKENRTSAIGEISRGLKLLARELDMAVVLLSQLNRSVDGRPEKRPLMSDLRDSGEIEQDADVILFPFRPSAYCQKCRDRVDTPDHVLSEHMMQAEIIIEKQRNGERNLQIPVAWIGQYQRFEGV